MQHVKEKTVMDFAIEYVRSADQMDNTLKQINIV